MSRDEHISQNDRTSPSVVDRMSCATEVRPCSAPQTSGAWTDMIPPEIDALS